MSLYYNLVFGVLSTEIVVFTILALPLPSKFRKPITLVLAKPFRSPTVQVTIKCILGFILLLFVDTINRVYSINTELFDASQSNMPYDRTEIQSRKFYAQRNMYLTGITLFLTFASVRTFGLVWELLELKEDYRGTASSPTPSLSVTATREELKKLIKEKDEEINLLKEQAEELQKEL